MRLTGGLDRGRRLIAPRGARTRPTAAKVREAIFNILGPPPGAGAGPLRRAPARWGSRRCRAGRRRAVFVERDRARAVGAPPQPARDWAATTAPTVIGADVRSGAAPAGARDERAASPGCSWIRPTSRRPEGVLAELCGRRPADRLRGRDRRARPPPPPARVGRLPVPDRPAPVRRHRAVVLPMLGFVSGVVSAGAVYPGTLRPDHQRPRRHPAAVAEDLRPGGRRAGRERAQDAAVLDRRARAS